MKPKIRARKPPSLDAIYHQLKEIEFALDGLSSLFRVSRSLHDERGEPVDLSGVGTLIDFARDKTGRIAGQVSEHALHRE